MDSKSFLSLPLLLLTKSFSLIFFIVKLITVYFDLVTLGGHIIFQRPWKVLKGMKRIRSVREDPNDPKSPFVRVGDPIPFDSKILEGETIARCFDLIVSKYGDSKCLGTRTIFSKSEEKQSDGRMLKKFVLDDGYTFMSYNQVNDKVNRLMNGFTCNGVRPGDKVILFAETRAEWLLSAFALWKLGAIVVTMYANLGLDGIKYVMEQTKATHMVASPDCLIKLSKISKKLKHLKVIFYTDIRTGRKPNSRSKFKFVSFEQLLSETKTDAKQSYKGPLPDDIFLIMYTSGSTGVPKGVQLSHTNLVFTIKGFLASSVGAYETVPNDAYLAYLPLAHVFEMAAEILMFTMGIPICYSSPMTMFDTSTAIQKGCKGDISVCKPTIMSAVPLVLDRIKKIIEDKMSTSTLVRDLFLFGYEYKKFWYRLGFRTPLMDLLIFRKVRRALGGNVRMMFVGGAPLSSEAQQFMRLVFEMKLLQGYAATETTACGSLMDFDDRSLGRCGACLFGAKVKLIDWSEGSYFNTDKPNPRGELVFGGDAVTMGYYMNEEETNAAYSVDENGVRWWRSGDIGEIFADGTIQIIDRKKDLVKLQHGEYISLGKVESVLKNCPFIDNICVYGDSFHNHLIGFVLPERISFMKLGETLGKDGMTFESLCSDNEMVTKIVEALREFGMSKGLLKNELPKQIKLCSEEWTPDNGLVTAALKIRRLQIKQFYRETIESLYSEP